MNVFFVAFLFFSLVLFLFDFVVVHYVFAARKRFTAMIAASACGLSVFAASNLQAENIGFTGWMWSAASFLLMVAGFIGISWIALVFVAYVLNDMSVARGE